MLRLTSTISLMLMLLVSAAHAQRNADLVPLGEWPVNLRIRQDVVNVGQTEDWFRNRSFRSLVLEAERVEVHMMAIRLVYLNGYTEDVRVDEFIPKGGQLEVNLGGERSYIKHVEMIYRARPDFRGAGAIKVFAEPFRRVDGNPGRNEWAELGCQEVSLFGRDRDSIRVGRQEGRFKAIRLLVRGSDVEILDLKVIYANGQPDDISVQHLIRVGERTRPLDLKGRERSIDRVEMVYRTAINPAAIIAQQQRIRTATVCVEGLQ